MNVKWVDKKEDIVPMEIDFDKTYTEEEAEKLLDGATFIKGSSPEGMKKWLMMTPKEREAMEWDFD